MPAKPYRLPPNPHASLDDHVSLILIDVRGIAYMGHSDKVKAKLVTRVERCVRAMADTIRTLEAPDTPEEETANGDGDSVRRA